MKWKIAISGDSNDLKELSKVCINSGLHITQMSEEFFLESSSFDNCVESANVKIKADEIIDYLNATKRITLQSKRPLFRVAIICENEKGEEKRIVETSLTGRCDILVSSKTVTDKDGKIFEEHPAESLIQWFPLSVDPIARKVFQIIRQDFDSWKGLCNIIEAMQEDNFSSVLKCPKYRDIVRDIKQTCQSFNAIGPDARHSHSKFLPPDNRISFSSAQKIVRELTEVWLSEKVKKS